MTRIKDDLGCHHSPTVHNAEMVEPEDGHLRHHDHHEQDHHDHRHHHNHQDHHDHRDHHDHQDHHGRQNHQDHYSHHDCHDHSPRHVGQMATKYVNMLLALDRIPGIHNMLASFFVWILLAGFILFPGTFTSLQNVGIVAGNPVGDKVLNTVQHVPLFVIAFICCGIGAAGMSFLWWRWMYNYVWLVNKIFMPGLMNSLAGIISTLSNVYGVQHGQFSTASKTTLIVTGLSAVICGAGVLYYSFWKLKKVKWEHDIEMGKERAGRHGEGVLGDTITIPSKAAKPSS